MTRRINIDTLGACASTLCTVHCILFPLLITVLPFATTHSPTAQAAEVSRTHNPAKPESGLACADADCCVPQAEAAGAHQPGTADLCCSTPMDFWIHAGLLAITTPLGLLAWSQGFAKHRRAAIPLLGTAGLALLALALFLGGEQLGNMGERTLTIAGSACLVSAHLWNKRKCACCSPTLPNHGPLSSVPSI